MIGAFLVCTVLFLIAVEAFANTTVRTAGPMTVTFLWALKLSTVVTIGRGLAGTLASFYIALSLATTVIWTLLVGAILFVISLITGANAHITTSTMAAAPVQAIFLVASHATPWSLAFTHAIIAIAFTMTRASFWTNFELAGRTLSRFDTLTGTRSCITLAVSVAIQWARSS